MNTDNKLKKKSMKTIMTIMLVLVFQVGELLSPFITLANASQNIQYDVDVTVVDYDNGTPIEGAIVTFDKRGSYAPVTRTSDQNGKLGVISLHNGKTDIYAYKYGYDECVPSTVTPNPKMPRSLIVRLKKSNVQPTKPNKPTITVSPSEDFVNDKVTATIHYSNDSTTEQYRIDIGNSVGVWQVYNSSFEIYDNCVIEAKGKNAYGLESDIAQYTVDNIDKTAPTLTLTQSTEDPKKIIAQAMDSESGVASIMKPDKSIENFETYPTEDSLDYTVSVDGTYEFTATDKAGNQTTKSIVINTTASTGVKMEVSDSSGTINQKYDSTINNLDYNIGNNGEPYKLYGQSNVAIDVKDKNATHLKYRFVKERQTSSEDDWQYIALKGDVNTTSPGYLTQMPYDVSHMPLMSNNAMWSNRNEVYKTPFADKTGLISTGITDSNTHYVTSENVRDKDGNSIIRWVPKTLFVKDQWVEGYASGYKEARKTWGYVKVDQTGDYYLKAFSDDGFYGTITVNGEVKVLGDDFRPRGVNDGGLNATNAIHLEEGVYYPIYLEYFNWGGRSAFEIQASLNGQNNYKLIGSANSHFTLYPSNSDSPIKNGNNIFMGSSTINFKTDPGIYTIEYVLLKEKDTSSTGQKEYDEISTGSFGKFQVEERFDGLSEAFSKDRVQQGETFNINYTVKPKPIKLTDLYKGKDSSNKPNSLYVKNLILTDKLPQGLAMADGTNLTDINKVTDIEYRYNSQTSEYEANEYTFSVSVRLTNQNLESVNFTQRGQIDYRDVSLKDDSRISQTQHFSNIPTFGGNSLIIKHGLYNGNEANITETESNEFNVSDGIPVTLAIIVQANSSNPAINLSIDTSKIPQETIEFKMYKISDLDSGTIDTTVSPTIIRKSNTGNINLTGLTMESGHKYLIAYIVTPSGSGETAVRATVDETSSKSVDLNISPKPDLF